MHRSKAGSAAVVGGAWRAYGGSVTPSTIKAGQTAALLKSYRSAAPARFCTLSREASSSPLLSSLTARTVAAHLPTLVVAGSVVGGPWMRARHYAAPTKKVSGAQQRPRIYVPSVGQIADPSVPPSGVELLNPKKFWARCLSGIRNITSLWQIRKLLKKEKYSTSAWLVVGRWTAEAAQHYRDFCEARANGDVKSLRSLTTDEFYDVVKGSVVEPSSKLKREWKAADVRAKVLALRMVALREPDVKFAQMLFRFTSQQTFNIKDTKGKLVAGSESPVAVTEYYVVERPLQDLNLFHWKFMGKLDPSHKEPLTKPMLEQ